MKAATPNVLVGWVEGIASPAGDEACDLTCRSLPYWSHRSMDETLSGRPVSGGRPLLAASPLPRSDAEPPGRPIDRLPGCLWVGATRSHSCGRDNPTACCWCPPALTWLPGSGLTSHPDHGSMWELAMAPFMSFVVCSSKGNLVRCGLHTPFAVERAPVVAGLWRSACRPSRRTVSALFSVTVSRARTWCKTRGQQVWPRA